MMAEIKNGGPAFPARPTEHLGGGISITAHPGMTLRDYFAAKALQGTLADTNVRHLGGDWVDFCDCLAKESYELADAMLRAREVNHD